MLLLMMWLCASRANVVSQLTSSLSAECGYSSSVLSGSSSQHCETFDLNVDECGIHAVSSSRHCGVGSLCCSEEVQSR